MAFDEICFFYNGGPAIKTRYPGFNHDEYDSGVCEKNGVLEKMLHLGRSPPYPRSQGWHVQPDGTLTKTAFFSQLGTLLLQSSATLKSGGDGGSSLWAIIHHDIFFADTGTPDKACLLPSQPLAATLAAGVMATLAAGTCGSSWAGLGWAELG